jgi:NADPH2:quinone reductase
MSCKYYVPMNREEEMQAGWYRQFGPAKEVLEIGEMGVPEVGLNEVRVRVHASGVNPSDVKKRAGYGEPFTEERIIPHSDGAGVIEAVGGGVDVARVGERVWVFNGQYERPLGTAAEYIALPATQVVPLPERVSFVEGACLGIPAMTAHRCLFADGPIKDQTILVTGGAGAVGHYVVQLAKWAGAKVLTTVSTPEKAAHAKEAGADHVINYQEDDVTAVIHDLTDGGGVDRIVEVEFGGNLAVTQEVLKLDGTVAVYASSSVREPSLPVYRLMYKNINLRFVLVYNMSQQAKDSACRDILEAIDDGALQHAVAARFPLDQLVAAHELVESGSAIGNVIVEISEE